MVCSAVVAGVVAGADVGVVDDAGLLAWSHGVEVGRRRLEADQVAVLAEIERRGLHAVDGHRGVDGFGRAVHRWSSRESKDRKSLMRLCRAAPEVLVRLRDGRLGVAQAHLLGATFCHPRVGELLLDVLSVFLNDAANVSMAQFERGVVAWRLLADQDGPDPERAMRNRAAGLAQGDVGFMLRANGPAIDGVQIAAILQRYEQAEWDADWAHVRAEHGDAACEALMPRTRQQRRYDALVAIFDDAVCTVAGGSPNEPLVNLMIDFDTFTETMTAMFDDDDATADERHADHDESNDTDDGGGAGRSSGRAGGGRLSEDEALAWLRRCSQTTDGQPVPPRDVVLAALRGQVRRVVIDRRGIVLDMGRRQRLFTGQNRQAVLLAATRCTHPGCDVPASRSQADHLVPFGHGGLTRTRDGGPKCGHHNRWRHLARSTSTLDSRGRWTTRRADGTDIAPPDHPHHAA